MWVIPKFNAKITKTLEGLKRNGVSLCSKKKAAERLPSSGCWGIDAILFWVLGGWIQHADTHTFTYLIDGHYTHTHTQPVITHHHTNIKQHHELKSRN